MLSDRCKSGSTDNVVLNPIMLSATQYYRSGIASALIYFGLWALIFSEYLTTAVPAYLILTIGLLLRGEIKLPLRVILYLCAVIFYWLAVFNYSTGKHIFTHILFYFGFLFPLVIFASDKRLSIGFFINEKLIVGLCCLILLEAILFNSPIAQYLYFLPAEGSNFRGETLGFYQRPMGIGGNPSLTSCILFFLVVLNDKIHGVTKFTTKFLLFVTTLVLASGTGFGLFVVYLFVLVFRSSKFSIRYLTSCFIYLAVLVAALVIAFLDIGKDIGFNKFSIAYFILIYNYKMYLLWSFMGGQAFETVLFGRQIISTTPMTTGDAGILTSANAIGLVGVGVLLIWPLLYFKSIWRNIIPTLFFYLSFIHYTGLLSPPGQILIACYVILLSQANRNLSQNL